MRFEGKLDRWNDDRGFGFIAPTRGGVATQLDSTSQQFSNPFRRDGRKHCSQISSCEEAKFFLKNCPDTQMDGDHDGIPCEQQWCTGMFGR